MNSSQVNSDFKCGYKEIAPNRQTAHLVLCFFEFTVESNSSAPIPHQVFPDGCVSLLYLRNEKLNLNLLLLKGLSLVPFQTRVFAGDVHWGVKFLPSSSAQILRCDPNAIPTQRVEDEHLLPHLTAKLLDKLSSCQNFAEAVQVFEKVLQDVALDEAEIDEKIMQAVRLTTTHKGEMMVSEIARLVGLSLRQLERRFKRASGITPKQFARVCRLRATAVNMLEGNMNWANRAAELGFADQAHLIREFSLLTQHSPKSFETKVKKIQHHKLVK